MPGRPVRLQLQALPCTLSPEEVDESLARASLILLRAAKARDKSREQEPTPPEVKAAA